MMNENRDTCYGIPQPSKNGLSGFVTRQTVFWCGASMSLQAWTLHILDILFTSSAANNATFKTVKSPCTIFLFSVECPQETAEAYKAGRGEGQLPTPLCRSHLKASPTQQKFSAPKVHYNGFPGNNQWGNQVDVCVASAV